MNIFKRLFKISEAEAHSAIEKLEDPIKLTEQGIRDMKSDLDKALQSLAEVKAMAIRAKRDMDSYKSKADNYEQKAIQLLQRAEKGDLATDEADRLATEALAQKEANMTQYEQSKDEKERFDASVVKLESNIRTLRSTISKWENELKTLKARVKVGAATKKINKQMAQIDGTETVALLERMKDKVAQEEALAESYGEIANESRSVDEEIEKALHTGTSSKKEELNALKEKLGITKKEQE